ncbi:hypothetical protein AB38_5017, partial [Escherichia coli 1-110-08_S1_C2]
RGAGATERSGNVADTVAPVQHQHGSQSAGIIFIGRVYLILRLTLSSG